MPPAQPLVDVPGAPPRLFALVPCAGVGERAGEALPKQYAMLGDRCVVAHTLNALSRVRRLAATLVVLAPADTWFEESCKDFAGWVAHCGGVTRAASVRRGLDELSRRGAADSDWVLVHDAARCLLRPHWVDRLIDACTGDPVGGLLALPLVDTLKEASQGRVARTLPRADKWVAQTPQMFRLGLLRESLARAGADATDEASAIEAAGYSPKLVCGALDNFKVTWPEDVELARRLLGGSDAGASGANCAAVEPEDKG